MNTELNTLALAIEAIGKSNFYERLCAYLRDCMPYDNVIAIAYQGTSLPTVHFRCASGPNVFRHLKNTYLAGAYVLDPIYQYHLKRERSGIFRLLDVAPDQFRRSRYYEWYYGRIGITDEISVVQMVGDDTTITISMGKDRSSGQMFSSLDERRLKRHEAVIMTLLKSHWSSGGDLMSRQPHGLTVTDDLIAAMRDQHNLTLSRRQAEVALLILQGHSSISIGLNLSISPQTVKVYRKQLYRRCNLSSQAELFALTMPILQQVLTLPAGKQQLVIPGNC
ncbi:helix-turn-helix transcriptional regulator [Mesorhizobium sp.]|uniref:helix-turn-helix transcriptional regulator n=1 Tax=Mesorhizobium sp. TaxID=1871066 RepID=UPI000FEA4D8A|nr:helix-turn-helix transcriptional regulator [Mesorhizobium sp.]RWM21649.1 MAG: LuxR family transcriptional regulator [Mesorhizobium sp.]RWM41049.1 MAG: LuxR family transcriptional regulator [Mesorhizobium sp.]TIO73769.1 MAG: helix-turn-helix transcriptional regulator [Mesorhizobium sp.]TIO82925.1 MAG: helix-turn-helix transcriptional regulator [Mesorhizobium sp.]TJV48717.1 MAG: helix-turn-helix transcriptional regulator [Mesorhizobium sp.]